MELKVVAQTLECERGSWFYRMFQSSNGVTISRVPKDRVLWSHQTVKQMYDTVEDSFVPSISCGRETCTVGSIEDAVRIIESQE